MLHRWSNDEIPPWWGVIGCDYSFQDLGANQIHLVKHEHGSMKVLTHVPQISIGFVVSPAGRDPIGSVVSFVYAPVPIDYTGG